MTTTNASNFMRQANLNSTGADTSRAVGNATAKYQPRARKHLGCDHCGGRFGMVTHRWWGNKFCKRTCKNAYLRENHHTLSGWVIPRFFAFAGGARPAWTGHSAAGR